MFSKTRNKAILALIIANIIWGAASPIFKLALQNIPPFTLAYIRFVGASLLLLPFAWKKLFIEKKDWATLFISSIFGITINIAFFFWGLDLAPSINAPIIASAGPIFIYLFCFLFLHEKSSKKMIFGMTLGLIGVFIIVGNPELGNGHDKIVIGNICFILATLGSVGYTIIGKKMLDKYHSAAVTFWAFVISSFTFLPFAFNENRTFNFLRTIDHRGYLGIIFGIFLSSALAYFLFDWGLKRISATESGLFTYIDPLAAIIIAVPLLGEEITPLFIFGSLLIFGGIFLAEGRIPYHPIHKLSLKFDNEYVH